MQTQPVCLALQVDETESVLELSDQLFRKLVGSRSGTAFTVHATPWELIEHPDRKVRLAVPEMLEWIGRLSPSSVGAPPDWPFVLSAGQRPLNNASQILRDPVTRANDPEGALYIHPLDLEALGVPDQGAIIVETARASIVVRAESMPSMRRGHIALPHGYGQMHPSVDGRRIVLGPAINWLTNAQHRDPVADTPHHKHVPARLRAAPPGAQINSVTVPAGAYPNPIRYTT